MSPFLWHAADRPKLRDPTQTSDSPPNEKDKNSSVLATEIALDVRLNHFSHHVIFAPLHSPFCHTKKRTMTLKEGCKFFSLTGHFLGRRGGTSSPQLGRDVRLGKGKEEAQEERGGLGIRGVLGGQRR